MAMVARSTEVHSSANAPRSAANVGSLARLQRSTGTARISFKLRDGQSVLDDLRQSGCCKLRFPRLEPGGIREAVLINTSGGLTDGDHITCEVLWRRGARATLTGQAAERIYKSRGELAYISNTLRVEEGATGLWLPQETILFDGGRFSRRLGADIAEGGRLLACESTVFGRAAMGETVETGALRDSWRVRYAGRLVFADGFMLDGNPQRKLTRPAIAAGANAIASVIYVDANAGKLIDPIRAIVEQTECLSGCSLIGPVLTIRLLGPSGMAMRRNLAGILQTFLRLLATGNTPEMNTAAAMLPRVWSC